jgi:hypothetical protein
MKGDIYHEELPDGRIRTSTVPTTEKSARQTTANDYWVVQPDGSRKLITFTSSGKKIDPNDQILREILEEVIAKSHRQWRSIPETTFLVLRAIEDYQSE